jgi:dolichol-phosphate mannosyltransferase
MNPSPTGFEQHVDRSGEARPIISPVTVLVPAYNEEAVIEAFMGRISSVAHKDWEILVVDDGSTDATASLLGRVAASDGRVRVVTHPENRGLGAALSTGFELARGEYVVTMDADLSHPVDLVPILLSECEQFDAVFGSRFVVGGSMEGVPAIRRLVSSLGNLVMRILLDSAVKDMTTGFRVYRRSAVVGLGLVGSGFETQLELTVRLLAKGARIAEIPLVLQKRAAGESKMRYLGLVRPYASMLSRMLRLRWGSKA